MLPQVPLCYTGGLGARGDLRDSVQNLRSEFALHVVATLTWEHHSDAA